MSRTSKTRLLILATTAIAALLALVAPAAANPPTDNSFAITFPAGVACRFPLRIVSQGGTAPRTREAGGVVHSIQAGKGATLDFTNLATGATYHLKANGSVNHTTTYPDGSQLVDLTGHNVLILFPTDNPAGPSTTLYIGRVTYTATPTQDFTILSSSGGKVDICAALS